jgi:mannose/fructose/N-acetylgalactosamine-specific phosphotransferase system component IIC
MPPWVPLALVSGPDVLSLLFLGLFTGLLALDDTAFAQTWFGQPLPAALMAGYLCGDPLTGLAVGLPLQLVLAGNLPVGQTFTGDATGAAVAAVAGLLMSGNSLAPGLVLHGSGSWPLLGWAILGAGLLSLLGHLLIQAERKANGLLMLEGHHSLRDGRLSRIERLHVRCLATTFARGLLSGLLFIMVMLRGWLPLFDHLPAFFQTALGTLPLLLPALGVGTLIDRYGLKSSWRWAGLGLVGTFLVARYVF